MESHYRGYHLQPVATPQGWGMVLGDPAGHVADVRLEQQLGLGAWPNLADAERAAHDAIDALLAEEDSY